MNAANVRVENSHGTHRTQQLDKAVRLVGREACELRRVTGGTPFCGDSEARDGYLRC
jgi:hypothetical protein